MIPHHLHPLVCNFRIINVSIRARLAFINLKSSIFKVIIAITVAIVTGFIYSVVPFII